MSLAARCNGAILADAKLGGARLDEGFCCGTYKVRLAEDSRALAVDQRG